MRRCVAIAALIVVFSLHVAGVCLEPQPRLVCAEFFASQVVVEAKLLHTKHVTPETDQDFFLYQMETEKILRGKIAANFEVWEENSSGRAPFTWKPGRSYLLFLTPSDQLEQHGNWELDGCGNSRPLQQAAAALNAIERISKTQSGLIQVRVNGLWKVPRPLQGHQVNAASSGKIFTGTTDKLGVANIKVVPGTYQVTVSAKEGEEFKPYEFSYDNPNSVMVQKGSCSQIQFVSQQ